MKIYTEVNFKWDDNKGKLVEVSSDSREYNGPIDECKEFFTGKSHSYDFGSGATDIGRTAFKLKDYDFGFPKQIPYAGGLGGYQGFSPEGKNIPHEIGEFPTPPESGWVTGRPTVPWSTKLDGSRIYSSDTKHRGNALQNDATYPKGDDMKERMQKYSEGFAEGYYKPYLRTALSDPISQTIGGAGDIGAVFEPLSAINQQVRTMLETLAGGSLSQFAGSSGDPLILKTDLGTAGNLMDDYAQAETDYHDTLTDLDEQEITAEQDKEKADYLQTLARKEIIGGLPSDIEQQQANIARTGMAYSAPAAERVLQEQAVSDKTLRDIVLEKRDIEDLYQGELSRIEDERGDAQKILTEAGEDVGEGLESMTSGASQAYTQMDNMMSDLYDEHKKFGEHIAGRTETPGTGDIGYRGKKFGESDIFIGGDTDEYMPGYYDEYRQDIKPGGSKPTGDPYPQAYAPFTAGLTEIDKFKQFQDWLGNIKHSDVASYLQGNNV